MFNVIRGTAGVGVSVVGRVIHSVTSFCVDRPDTRYPPPPPDPHPMPGEEGDEDTSTWREAFREDDAPGEGLPPPVMPDDEEEDPAVGAERDPRVPRDEEIESLDALEAKAKEYEKEYEALNSAMRTVETELLEVKQKCVIHRPIHGEECAAQAEKAAKDIFDLKNGGRHIHLIGDVFDVEEMLQKARILRDQFPATTELKHTYETLEAELSQANGRRLEKKQDLVGELDFFLSLNRDVLKMESIDSIVADSAVIPPEVIHDEEVPEELNVRPEFFDHSRLKENKLKKRLTSLGKALAENSRLEEAATNLSAQQALLVDLEKYFKETKEKLLHDVDQLKANKAEFKLEQAENAKQLEESKLKLRFEKDDLLDSIRSKRAQIDADFTKLVGVVMSIREKEREEDIMHKVDHKVEEILAEAQRVLNSRVDDTVAGSTIARIQQGIGENIKERCVKRLQERRAVIEERVLQSHTEFYDVSRAHWGKCVLKHNQANEYLKDLKRQLTTESNALRKQRKQFSEQEKLADKGIIRLQEALYEQRLRLVNEKKAEVDYWKKELSVIDGNLNQLNTVKALRDSPKYAQHVQQDFRDEFVQTEKQREFLEWIEHVKDHTAAVCDMKEGLVNPCKDEPNTECLENLLDTLESMEDRGGYTQVNLFLANKPEIRNQLRVMHNIIRDAIENDSISSNVIVYGRSLRAALNTVKSKLALFLQTPAAGREAPAASEGGPGTGGKKPEKPTTQLPRVPPPSTQDEVAKGPTGGALTDCTQVVDLTS